MDCNRLKDVFPDSRTWLGYKNQSDGHNQYQFNCRFSTSNSSSTQTLKHVQDCKCHLPCIGGNISEIHCPTLSHPTQFAIVLLAVFAVTSAKPSPQLLAYSAPLVSAPGAFAPYATAVASREFHGASPFYASPYSAPYVAAPAAYAAYSAYPYVL